MHKYKEVKRQLLFTYASDHTTYDMFNRVFGRATGSLAPMIAYKEDGSDGG